MLSKLYRLRSFSTVVSSARLSSTDIVKQKPVEILAKEEKLPIEKTSLSRGLALNKFEKVCFCVTFTSYCFLCRIS